MSAALRLEHDQQAAQRVEAASFVLALRSHGISDLAVLRAMETVSREHFAPRRYLDLARQDVALPLAFGQTMTGPATVASMLSSLAVQPGDRVLEIGTGSGYVTALLARLGAQVRSLERHPVLAEAARHRLRAAGFGATCEILWGDGFEPADAEARFDRILVNGGLPAMAGEVSSQLAAGGRLVFGHRPAEGATRLVTLVRDEAGRLTSRVGPQVRLSGITRGVVARPAPWATEA